VAITDKKVTAPALPYPPEEYEARKFGDLTNILRLYFNRVDVAISALIGQVPVSVRAYTLAVGNYTINTAEYLVEYQTGTFTATLPSAVGIAGQEFQVKNSGTGSITLDGEGSETIDGVATKALSQYVSIKVMSNGTNWIII